MPFRSDNIQDVWGRIDSLKTTFQPREDLLKECDAALSVTETSWAKERKKMIHEADKARLMGQQQAATVRVAVPFKVRLPTFPDQSGMDQRCLENTEHAAATFWEMATQDARQRGLRDPRYDMAAYAVEQGAIAGMAWWRENRKGEWWPRLELYAPRYVWYDTDDEGMVFYCIGFTLSEAQLAGIVEARQWQGQYGDTKAERQIYQVWMRDGAKIVETVVGAPGAQAKVPLPLVEPRERPECTEIPCRYIPAGGPVSRLWTTGGKDFEQVYGQPFIAPGVPVVDSMKFLSRMIFRAGLTAVEPGGIYRPAPGEADVVPEVELGWYTLASGEFVPAPQVNAAAIPFLQQQHAALANLLEQVGLPGPLMTGSPTPRSELLRQGLEEMGQQALVPFWGCLGGAAGMFSEDWRRGQHYLYKKGVKSMTLEMEPSGVVTVHPKRENRAYGVDNFWWDGTFEVILKPPDAREMLVRNFQVYNLATSNGRADFYVPYLQELLLGIDDPELQHQKAVEQRLLEAQAPVMALFRIRRDLARLERLNRLVGQGRVEQALDKKASVLDRLLRRGKPQAKLTQEDVSWLADMARTVGMTAQDVLGWTEEEFVFLIKVETGRMKDLQQRLIPQSQVQKGQAPQPGALVAPAETPTQGGPASMGFNGGGGPNDAMAAQLRAQSGSDQTGGM